MAQNLSYDVDSIGGGGLGGFGYGNNPLLWLITLGFLKGDNLFGGNNGAGMVAGENKASIDCLQQGQASLAADVRNNNVDAQLRAIVDAVGNQTNAIGDVQDTVFRENQATLRQLAECCCDLKAGQQSIKTDVAMQTATLVAEGKDNTQKILDALCANQIAVKDAEIRRLQDALQTQTIISNCNGGGGQSAPQVDINVLAAALAGRGQQTAKQG